MEDVFEELISSFMENHIGISPHFLSQVLVDELRQSLLLLNAEKLLLAAGVGNAHKLLHDVRVRSDVIYWLDKAHHNAAENAFFSHIEAFIRYLNMTCFTGITECEFHYSVYEKGSFYTKHLDQFKNDSRRTYSMICYLNDHWQSHDGGELLVYQPGNNFKIAPIQGKAVLFKSNELYHEVLLTQQTRLSVTGWLKRG